MTKIYNIDEIEDGRIIRDGEGIRVRLTLADAAMTPIAAASRPAILHRPGPLAIVDGDASETWVAARRAVLADAWRAAPPNVGGAAQGPAALENVPMAPVLARDARHARLQQAFWA